jgi:hypothetical protein
MRKNHLEEVVLWVSTRKVAIRDQHDFAVSPVERHVKELEKSGVAQKGVLEQYRHEANDGTPSVDLCAIAAPELDRRMRTIDRASAANRVNGTRLGLSEIQSDVLGQPGGEDGVV